MNINPFDILKNAQKLQEQMGSFQEKLVDIVVTGTAGGGMVAIDLNGRMEMVDVRVAPEVAKDGDVQMLQDLIIAAFTQASDKIKEALKNEMGGLAAGLGGKMPEGFPLA
ncbi:nucleoid-associated protein [Spirochaetia bacterium]|nr:nucleoid-associated protein [Spirochaetia bacterium]